MHQYQVQLMRCVWWRNRAGNHWFKHWFNWHYINHRRIILCWTEEIDPAFTGISVKQRRTGRESEAMIETSPSRLLCADQSSVLSMFVDYPWHSALFCPGASAVNSVAEDAQKVSHGAHGVRRGQPPVIPSLPPRSSSAGHRNNSCSYTPFILIHIYLSSFSAQSTIYTSQGDYERWNIQVMIQVMFSHSHKGHSYKVKRVYC